MSLIIGSTDDSLTSSLDRILSTAPIVAGKARILRKNCFSGPCLRVARGWHGLGHSLLDPSDYSLTSFLDRSLSSAPIQNRVPASTWHGLCHSLPDPTDYSLTSSKYGQKSLKRTYCSRESKDFTQELFFRFWPVFPPYFSPLSFKRTYTKPAKLTWLAKSSICPL